MEDSTYQQSIDGTSFDVLVTAVLMALSLTGIGWVLSNGTVNAPSLRFIGNAAVGLFYDTVNTVLGIAHTGNTILSVASDHVRVAQLEVEENSTASPDIHFVGETGTGLGYDSSVSNMYLADSGTKIVDFGSGTIDFKARRIGIPYIGGSDTTDGLAFFRSNGTTRSGKLWHTSDDAFNVGCITNGDLRLLLRNTYNCIVRPYQVSETNISFLYQVGTGAAYSTLFSLTPTAITTSLPYTSTSNATAANLTATTKVTTVTLESTGTATCNNVDINGNLTVDGTLTNESGARLYWISDITGGTMTDGTNNFTGQSSDGLYSESKFSAVSDFCMGYVYASWTGKGSASGNMYIQTDLPNLDASFDVPCTVGNTTGVITTGRLSAVVHAGTGQIWLYDNLLTGLAPTRLNGGNFSTAGNIMVSFSYPTNSIISIPP